MTFGYVDESVSIHQQNVDENFNDLFKRVYFPKGRKGRHNLFVSDKSLEKIWLNMQWSVSIAEGHQHKEDQPKRALDEKKRIFLQLKIAKSTDLN